MSVIFNILLLILVLGLLVFVHELGHYTVARLVKAKVLEFSLGFGPALFSKRYHGILYAVRVIPLGGYVKILGDGDPGEEDIVKESDWKNSLDKKSKFAQILVMLAGIFMNISLAVTIYYVVIGMSGWKLYVNTDLGKFNPFLAKVYREKIGDVKYIEVKDESSASKANLPKEGIIASIDGKSIEYSDEISKLIKAKRGQDIVMNICVKTEPSTVDAVLNCEDYTVKVPEEGVIGIVTTSNYVNVLSYENFKIFTGFAHLYNNLNLIKQEFTKIFLKARSTGDYTELSNSVSGPIGMYYIIDHFKTYGIVAFLSIIADLSLSLAIMNILPIPALDGGRVFILMLEAIFRKDMNKNVEALIINISFIILIVFMVGVIIKDILNIHAFEQMFK